MNPTIQKLNKLICEEYNVEIKLDQSLILDSYDEGELEENTFYHNVAEYCFYSQPHTLSEKLRNKLNFILSRELQFGTISDLDNGDEFGYYEDRLCIMQQTREDRSKPSEDDVELWKKGDLKLYNLYTEFKIYFNGQQLFDLDIIRDLVKG
tara:strand:+ start:1226 stop:1678 length:453 start_codon:yes stop_codon:yes gene_type:complete